MTQISYILFPILWQIRISKQLEVRRFQNGRNGDSWDPTRNEGDQPDLHHPGGQSSNQDEGRAWSQNRSCGRQIGQHQFVIVSIFSHPCFLLNYVMFIVELWIFMIWNLIRLTISKADPIKGLVGSRHFLIFVNQFLMLFFFVGPFFLIWP